MTTNIGGYSGATGVVLQSDGKIVVCGLDFTFGMQGSVRALPPSFGRAVLLQDDGRIAVGGDTVEDLGGGNVVQHFAVARFFPDGNADTSFGTGMGNLEGFLEVGFGGSSGADMVLGLAGQPDGRILAAGIADAGTGNLQIALVRIWP